jgi:hypothetical protein
LSAPLAPGRQVYRLPPTLRMLGLNPLGTAASLLFHRAKLKKLSSLPYILPSLHNNPEYAPSFTKKHLGKKIVMLSYSFSTLNSHHPSLLIVTQYLNIKIFLFLLPIHFYIHKKPSSHIYINLFLVTTTKICSYHSSTFIHTNPSTE